MADSYMMTEMCAKWYQERLKSRGVAGRVVIRPIPDGTNLLFESGEYMDRAQGATHLHRGFYLKL